MLVIATNITTRSERVRQACRRLKVREGDDESAASVLQDLAKQCVAAGADAIEINTQQYQDRPEAMEFAVKAIQQVTDSQLCLSTNNAEAVEAGLQACRRAALVNYVSIDESKLREILPLVARHGAEAILLITDPAVPRDAQEMLKRATVLIGAANEAGISNDRIMVDPGLLHITSDIGQRHFVQVMEFLRALPEASDPAVKSTCWIGNTSAGAPTRLRSAINTAVLAVLSGLGLSCAFLNVLKVENMRMVRLIRILRNQAMYSERDLEP